MRQSSPAALRNREPIREVLAPFLPTQGRVLEVPCGTGVHSAWLSAAFPGLEWLPADLSDEALLSTGHWRDEGGPLLREPVRLDVTQRPWGLGDFDAVIAINLIHAAPPEVTPGLLLGAAESLRPGGILYLYGPYRESGVTAPSNEVFERDYLRQRDPSWGLRELDEVRDRAAAAGFVFEKRVQMPANNLSVVFRRTDAPHSLDVR